MAIITIKGIPPIKVLESKEVVFKKAELGYEFGVFTVRTFDKDDKDLIIRLSDISIIED
jgi:hypothetical protein